MKILNLVIHNSTIKIYNDFYCVLSPFYKKFNKFVDTFFIEYSEHINESHKVDCDSLKIKGVESLIPGILWKTLDALVTFEEDLKKYDYIVRSNVSTVVNFKVLHELLKTEGEDKEYFGGVIYRLDCLDHNAGVVDKKYIGALFVSGTLICMTRQFCEFLLRFRHKINSSIIDDVAIGIFFAEYCRGKKLYAFPDRFHFLSDEVLNTEEVDHIIKAKNPVAWRNKSQNREIDLINMKTEVDCLTDGMCSTFNNKH